MVAAQTIPISAAVNANAAKPPAGKPAAERLWTPDHRDRQIYELVTMEGLTQAKVASMQRISQASVCRIVQRYRRWLGHAGPGVDGTLPRAEQVVVQRRLTYERNERMLEAAMRLAHDLEGTTELSSRVTRCKRGGSPDYDDLTNAFKWIDRSGEVCRFLRLAFRINMQQLKLVEEDDSEPLAPLTVADMQTWEAAQALWAEDEEAQNAEGRMQDDSSRRAAGVSRPVGSPDETPPHQEADASRSPSDFSVEPASSLAPLPAGGALRSTPATQSPHQQADASRSQMQLAADDDSQPLPPQDEIDAALDRIEAGQGTDADHALIRRLEREAMQSVAEREAMSGAVGESPRRAAGVSRPVGSPHGNPHQEAHASRSPSDFSLVPASPLAPLPAGGSRCSTPATQSLSATPSPALGGSLRSTPATLLPPTPSVNNLHKTAYFEASRISVRVDAPKACADSHSPDQFCEYSCSPSEEQAADPQAADLAGRL